MFTVACACACSVDLRRRAFWLDEAILSSRSLPVPTWKVLVTKIDLINTVEISGP